MPELGFLLPVTDQLPGYWRYRLPTTELPPDKPPSNRYYQLGNKNPEDPSHHSQTSRGINVITTRYSGPMVVIIHSTGVAVLSGRRPDTQP